MTEIRTRRAASGVLVRFSATTTAATASTEDDNAVRQQTRPTRDRSHR